MINKLIHTLCLCLLAASIFAQPNRWQQYARYEMEVDMNVNTHQYDGVQRLTYVNNSPDTLKKLYYHLYFNAFQPNSMMDVRSRTIADPDKRVADRISKLKPEEQGFIKVQSLSRDGRPLKFVMNETVLEVTLVEPIAPHDTTLLEMQWQAQVPLQVRRSGRNSSEGVAYSMTQWYPKLCEYDYQGWHANPYVAREFYGVWGDFDVKIKIDKNYTVAAGGYLQNPQSVGKGYETPGQKLTLPEGDKLTYHFSTPNVHDFVWAADKDYTHTKIIADDGTTMRFFWKKSKGYDEQWQKLPAIMNRARTHMNALCGKYPYKEYCFIQGGDGGMEYPLATLITGNRPLASLAGVAIHEQLHSWYQMILGTNESLYGWMDEGFTSYAESLVENEIFREGLIPDKKAEGNLFEGTYKGYVALATSGKEEPMTTHADHFHTNFAYSYASYVKGSVFLHQLGYIIGQDKLKSGLLRYFDTWKFKHPNDNDLIRVFEEESGLELDWYKEDWVNSTNTIDYGVTSVEKESKKVTEVVISRIGRMAMPLDILVTYKNGDQELFYAPLESMRGEKMQESKEIEQTLLPDHRWVDLEYRFEIPMKLKKIVKIEIDPQHRMADIERANNVWEKSD